MRNELKELRLFKESWTIDADEMLLEFLDGFSARMMDRAKHVQKIVNDLVYETKNSEVQLNNTFNELIMLSNTQFIENVSIIILIL